MTMSQTRLRTSPIAALVNRVVPPKFTFERASSRAVSAAELTAALAGEVAFGHGDEFFSSGERAFSCGNERFTWVGGGILPYFFFRLSPGWQRRPCQFSLPPFEAKKALAESALFRPV